jgi:hypothetical protein
MSGAPITAITVDFKVGTRLALFSFDASIVSFFQPGNGPFNGQVRGMLLSGKKNCTLTWSKHVARFQ